MIELGLTMESGQPPHFLWRSKGRAYWRLLGGRVVKLWQSNEKIEYEGLPASYVESFLRLDHPLEEVYEVIATTGDMERAVEKFSGLRITRNDLWETLVSFICSTNSNLARIRGNVRSLLNEEGEIPLHLYRKRLDQAKLGYRENYITESSRLICRDFLQGLEGLGNEEARARLMELPGVGPKVAACTLLFALDRLDAFPMDVWIKRAMKRYFGISSEREARAFAREEWHPYEGYAQQYLYMLAREEL